MNTFLSILAKTTYSYNTNTPPPGKIVVDSILLGFLFLLFLGFLFFIFYCVVEVFFSIFIKKHHDEPNDYFGINTTNSAQKTISANKPVEKTLDHTKSKNNPPIVTPVSQTIKKQSQKTITKENTRVSSHIQYDTDLYKIYKSKQGSVAWLELRKGRVTGTSAYYLKNHSVKYAITRTLNDSNYRSAAMIRGQKLEPIGISLFAKLKSLNIISTGFIKSKKYDFAGYSPDGVVCDDNGKIKTIIEHKAFGRDRHLKNFAHVEPSIMYQIQFGMFITGAKDAYLVLYNPDIPYYGNGLLFQHITKDKEIHELFKSKLDDYAKDHYYDKNLP